MSKLKFQIRITRILRNTKHQLFKILIFKVITANALKKSQKSAIPRTRIALKYIITSVNIYTIWHLPAHLQLRLA